METNVRLAETGWEKLANGCYGTVFKHAKYPKWVIKQAANDGTRTYLEWVWIKTLRGERMRGMPHLDFVAAVSADRYMVGMRRYEPLPYDWKAALGGEMPDYLQELIYAFTSDCPAVRANDLHSGNFMKDGKDYILTDPSSSSYRPVGAVRELWDMDSGRVLPTASKFELVG